VTFLNHGKPFKKDTAIYHEGTKYTKKEYYLGL